MWSQDSSDKSSSSSSSNSQSKQKQESLSSGRVDSGFVSYSDSSEMRAYASGNTSDVETLIRDLRLEDDSINNLEAAGGVAQRLDRMNVKWREIENTSVIKHPYDFFFKQDCDGDTQLHISITLNLLEASYWLISIVPHPCLLDIINDDTMSALHIAVISRQSEIVRRLVLAGASRNIATQAGNTPLHLACAIGDLACAQALTEPPTSLEINWISNPNGRAQPLDLELKNHVGQTCLHVAALKGHLELVGQLLSLGANADTVEGLCGRSAIHLAVEFDQQQVVHYLSQERRSCLEAVTYAGLTPYQFALQLNKHQMAADLLIMGALPIIVSSESSCDSGNSSSFSETTDDSSSSSDDERF